jgi:hypothetical protein
LEIPAVIAILKAFDIYRESSSAWSCSREVYSLNKYGQGLGIDQR